MTSPAVEYQIEQLHWRAAAASCFVHVLSVAVPFSCTYKTCCRWSLKYLQEPMCCVHAWGEGLGWVLCFGGVSFNYYS